MLSTAFTTRTSLRGASRLRTISGENRVSAAEIAILFACGALAALAIGLVHLRVGMPGHAIFRAVLPMAMGLALVPRRSSGMVMSFGAGVTAAAMSVGQFGFFPPAALLSILILGPALDVALLGKPQGWRLYTRFILAGAAANLAAFSAKVALVALGWEMRGGRHFMEFWSAPLLSFAIWGAVAGLVSAAICFRLRAHDDLRRA
jgi:hypothetical protein